MTHVLILEQVPLLAVGIRSILERMTAWEIQTARQEDPLAIAQLVENARQDVTIFDDTAGGVLALLGLLGWQHVPSLGMTVVVTAARRSEETLFYLARWGVAAYLSAEMTQTAFAETVQRVSAGEWMLTSKEITRPPCRQQQEPAPACANTSSSRLTLREIEVLTLVAQGKGNKEIARSLLVSEQTIKNHLTAIYRKFAVNDRTAAVVTAIRRELIKLPAGPTPAPPLYASVA